MTGLPNRIPAPDRSAVPTLAATRISVAILPALTSPRLDGRVLSAHRTAVNVDAGGWLLTLATPAVGGLPNGVAVACATLDGLGLRPGMEVKGDGRTMRVGPAGQAIDLATALTWNPRLPVMPEMAAGERRRRVEDALLAAGGESSSHGLGPLLAALATSQPEVLAPLADRIRRRLADLLAALGHADLPGAVEAATDLIGLGPGATPSGDDLLVGLAAGLAATQQPHAAPFAAAVAERAAGRTTTLAAAFLLHAGRLEFAERVHRAVIGVLAPSAMSRRRAVGDAMAWGASSGTDLLVGLLAGLHPAPAALAGRLRAGRWAHEVAA
jgi:hypothetical protein